MKDSNHLHFVKNFDDKRKKKYSKNADPRKLAIICKLESKLLNPIQVREF